MYTHQEKVYLRHEFENIKSSIASSSYDDLPKCVLESALLISWLMKQYPRHFSANLAPGSLHTVCCAVSCFLDEFDVSTLLLTPVKYETLPAQSEDHDLSVQELSSSFEGEQSAGADELFSQSPALSPIFGEGAKLSFEPQMALRSSIELAAPHSLNTMYPKATPLVSWSDLCLPSPMYVVDEDDTPPTSFDKFDYYVDGEYLYCCICETNAYEINALHASWQAHSRRVIRHSATSDEQSPDWEVVEEDGVGFLRCNPCRKQYEIETHSAGKMHTLSKEFKYSKKLWAKQSRMYQAWESMSGEGVFDDLLTIEGARGETSFCVGCDQLLVDSGARYLHQTESIQHKSCVRTLWNSDIFSYAFGITRKGCIQYCTLCKVGLSNAIEHDHHVYSKHSTRHATLLRDFRARVFPAEFELFHQPVRDGNCYSLDEPLRQRLMKSSTSVEAETLLRRLIHISVYECAMCSLCDQYVSELSYTKHCRTSEHLCLEQKLKESLRQPSSKHFGIVQKRNGTVYCVPCHVGFTNNVELNLHVNSESPHKNNVKILSSLVEALV